MIFMFLSHMELLQTVCDMDKELALKYLKETFFMSYVACKKTPPDFKYHF